jgi:hypothetical protein
MLTNIHRRKYKFKKNSLSVLGLFIFSCSWLSGQIKPIADIPLHDKHKLLSKNGQHSIILSNDSNGLFYLNYISGDTLMLRRHSETSSQNFALKLKNFDVNNGLQHCIVKHKDRIILLNRSNNSIQCYEFKGSENTAGYAIFSDTKVKLENTEKLIRIERDNQNVYLVSYNSKSRSQKFYRFNPVNSTIKLLYSYFNPFLEIFFSDHNVSNYSFYNNKLALTDFYSGNSFIINLLNTHIDTVKLPYLLNEKRPSLGTFDKLNNKYNKHATWANFDSLMNLVNNYNYIINSFFLNDSTLLITVRFIDPNLAPFDMIAFNVITQRELFKQKDFNVKHTSETVNLTNLPIYLCFEEANYFGDGTIYVYKEMPELNKYDFGGFFNQIEQLGGSKIGTFVLYKNVPASK